jgi:UDP-N-acetylglucosamine acyltransferase
MSAIHPTAIVSPQAHVDPSVDVGPYAVIDADVTLGPGCRVGPHVYLTGHTTIGANNQFHAGCVLGDAPQDLKYKDEPTRLVIGDGNTFREGSTIHRSAKMDGETVIGSHCYIMVNSHVGHNARLGNHVILANGVLLAGHVEIGDRAFLSGNCLVHQFVRIGPLVLMQGGSAVSRDLPPFTIARGGNNIGGLNVIGLRRAGIGPAERLELKKLYRLLFRSGQNLTLALEQARQLYSSPSAKAMIDFVASSKRGVCGHHGRAFGELEDEEEEAN